MAEVVQRQALAAYSYYQRAAVVAYQVDQMDEAEIRGVVMVALGQRCYCDVSDDDRDRDFGFDYDYVSVYGDVRTRMMIHLE